MIVMYKKENLLYAKVMMDLRLPIQYQNEIFGKGKQEKLLLPEAVMQILTRNGNIRIYNGKKYIKLNLGQFYDIIHNNRFRVEEMVEPKKEEPKVEPKKEVVKEQPKVEPKKEEPKVEPKKEVVKEQPKVEEKKPENKKYEQHENKKQRHNNNNNNKQQNQGGDK